VKKTCWPLRSVHGTKYAESGLFSDARAAPTFLSNHASSSSRSFAALFISSIEIVDRSTSCLFIVSTVHVIMLTMWLARFPIENDLSCGFQPNVSVGTRSSTLRVDAIS